MHARNGDDLKPAFIFAKNDGHPNGMRTLYTTFETMSNNRLLGKIPVVF